ncbi:MAG: STAS/SEC14 domain-containing protein, partial [Acidobacteriota bacterium]
MQKINRGLPAATWRHYGELKEKRREESLTASEQAELIALSDNIEAMNVRRMESVIQLARLR